jgi:hypothetical protein
MTLIKYAELHGTNAFSSHGTRALSSGTQASSSSANPTGVFPEDRYDWLKDATATVAKYQDYLLSSFNGGSVPTSTGSNIDLYTDFLLGRGHFSPPAEEPACGS